MDLFTIITYLLVLSAIFGYINIRFLKLPATIGLMILALAFSILLILINYINPAIFNTVEHAIEQINFSDVVLNVMLSFLLFAGAMHTDSSLMRKERRSILLFSLCSVLISAIVVALLLYGVILLTGYKFSFIYCLLFGVLISPTDPIAVLGILTKANVPRRIEINIVGESLFNDGIGVVIFLIILQIINEGVNNVSFGEVVLLFIRQAIGGLLFGLVIGYITFILLKPIDHYETEVMMTIAMVIGGYYLANKLHVSGPLAIVVAGLFTGSRIRYYAMSDTTSLYLDKFWELIDVLMNAVLFVLIGLRLMVLDYKNIYLFTGILAIPIVLFARYISIRIPVLLSKKWIRLDKRGQLLMTWGGLRGGLAIAMALSISTEHKDMIVFITYIVVLFSILVQGLTVGRFARRLYSSS
ncbi:MAG TPA: sodium:proton antiporter [Chitinophagaceae bacterium]|jgi:CPA1 family monovalent cation:H+ antiporter